MLCLLVLWRTVGLSAAPDEKNPKPGGPPPLKVDKEAPLLLDEPNPKGVTKTPVGRLADNSACHVCHTNYQEESLALVHAKANVGCVKCHGDSIAHRNDEANITPPDTLYPLAKIDTACHRCHKAHDAPAAKVIGRWQERCPAKTNPKDIVCTDCHGEHRLKLRTVRWDKETRKLLLKDGEGKKPPAK
jgi:formate-dependent nitrite reductase cytochrome c552 subunit